MGMGAFLFVTLVLVVLAGMFLVTSRVEITMADDRQITLTDHQMYNEPGAEARFVCVFNPDGYPLNTSDIVEESNVDSDTPGSYAVTYQTDFFLWSASAKRHVVVQDIEAPQLSLAESETSYLPLGEEYVEPGFEADDDYDGDVTSMVEVSGEVDPSTPGTYTLTYTITDSSGNESQVTREVVYRDITAPVIELEGDQEITIDQDTEFDEPGWSASDDADGDLTDAVLVDGSVDTATPGTYTLTYAVTDSAGNQTQATRTVTVKEVVKEPPKTEAERESEPIAEPEPVPDHKVVYLTFDDGPGQYTQELLDVLAKYNVKATFFVTGNGDPSLIAAEYQAGHAIGVHTYTHNYDAIYASEDAFFADYERMQAVIVEQTGQRTTLMRFPGGSSNTVSDFNPGVMTRLTQQVTAQGYQYFDWNVSSGDAGSTTDTEQVAKNIIAGIEKHDVSIVLQHDIKGFSVDAVEEVIKWGLDNGYTFLPLTASSPTAHHGVNN